jgi:hypothetical protein
MAIQYWHAAWTSSIDKQHGHAAETCSMDMRHGHAVWTGGVEIHQWTCSLVMRHGPAVWTCSREPSTWFSERRQRIKTKTKRASCPTKTKSQTWPSSVRYRRFRYQSPPDIGFADISEWEPIYDSQDTLPASQTKVGGGGGRLAIATYVFCCQQDPSFTVWIVKK